MAVEIEKKFLVTTLPADLTPGIEICQGYILNTPGKVVRVRIKGNQGFLTVKGRTVAAVRPEFEYEIPVSDARQMLDLFCGNPVIEKCRHTLAYKGIKWVIDRFYGANQGLVVAEVELSSRDQVITVPPWAGKEVTEDARYYNASLVHYPFSSWPDASL
ncbi:MAG: CYTH domain-containing protein [Desulfotignum sp.]|jgi:CYTH domain-containing protein|nr:CYTH domain-containing protein [Desulfotignum sp.]